MKKNYLFLLLLISTAIILPTSALATPVLETITQQQTSKGQSIDFTFSGLPVSDGTDGFLTIASASGDTFDLSAQAEEYFNLILDGNSAGRYTCSSNVTDGINMGCGGSTDLNTFNLSLSFSSLLSDFAVNMPSLISDGSLTVTVDFGSEVNHGLSQSQNFLDVTLDYTVPEPSALALMGLGLLGFGIIRLKQKKN